MVSANKHNESMLCVGKIVAAHGIKGEVRIRSYTSFPEDIASFQVLSSKDGSRTWHIEKIVAIKEAVVTVKIKGIVTRNEAEALKGCMLFVPRDTLPPPEEEEFYYTDLIGLRVLDAKGSTIGEVKAMHSFGAGDIIEIVFSETEKTEFFSFTKEIIPTISITEGYVVLCPPEVLEGEKPERVNPREKDGEY